MTSNRSRPLKRIVLTPFDAEVAARDWLGFLGFADARVTVTGPDEGIDVVSADVVAQVKAVGQPVGRPVVQQIYGVASLHEKRALLFTMEGVTRQAREWADRAGVGLFRLDRAGGVTAENGPAERLLDEADGVLTGWSAVRAELEQMLADGTPAEISSVYESSTGQLGYWMVGHDGDSSVKMSSDLAGSKFDLVASVSEAVDRIAAAVRSTGASFQDCRPFLTVEGSRQRFFPRLSYQAAAPEPENPQRVDVSDLPTPSPASHAVHPSRPDAAQPLRITASDLYQALADPPCDRRIFLSDRGIEGSAPSALAEMMRDLGAAHEDDYLASLGPSVDLGDGSITDRVASTSTAIDRGDDVLYQAVFSAERTIAGHRCTLVGAPDFVLSSPDGWIIRDTKVARRVDPGDRPDIHAQLQFYGWLFEQTRHEPPGGLEVLTGAGEIQRYEYEGWPSIEDAVERIVRLKSADDEPDCRTRTAHSGCPYFDRCWPDAVGRADVSTLPGMTAGLTDVLESSGVTTLEELTRSYDETTLAELRITVGRRIQRVGSRADRILRSAESLVARTPIWIQEPELPTHGHVALFDLEGVPAFGNTEGSIYLWGTEVWGPSPSDYVPVFAGFDTDGPEQGWFSFLRHAEQLFSVYGADLPFVHWASYERTQIRQHIDRFGDRGGVGAQVLENLVDLLKITKDAVMLPVYSYRLKQIEKYVGFERSQNEFGGDWSIVVWQNTVAAQDEETRARLLDQLAVYNREDCAATGAVHEWLSRNSPSRG